MIRVLTVLAAVALLALLALPARAAEIDQLKLTRTRSATRHHMKTLLQPSRIAAIGAAIRGTKPKAAVTHTAPRSARVAREFVARAVAKTQAPRTWGKARVSRDTSHETGESSSRSTQTTGRKAAAKSRSK